MLQVYWPIALKLQWNNIQSNVFVVNIKQYNVSLKYNNLKFSK